MDTEYTSVADILRTRVSQSPASPAMEFEGRTTTLAALDQRSNQVAHALLQSLPEADGRAGLLDSNTDLFFELLFGAAKANRILVPINSRLAPEEIVEIVNDAGLGMLFVGGEFLGMAHTLATLCPTVRQIITLEGNYPGWDQYAVWRDREPTTDPNVPVDSSDVVLLVYTSGTTGQAKGAMLTHQNLLTNAPLLAEEYGRSSEPDVGLVCLPLFHVSGSLWGLACLYAGASLVIVRRLIPGDVLRTIAERRVTKALLVPAVIQLLLDAAERESYDLSSLDFILYGASPIAVPLLVRAMSVLRCHFGQVYGLTETAGSITYLRPEDHDLGNPTRLQSCGRRLRHAEIRVVDSLGCDVEPGREGEIICRSKQNMKGYWNRPRETAEALRDEWLHTGDVGYFDTDGYLFIHDRLTDVFRSGSEKVYPAEVERVLSQHPAVADVAVIGIPDARWGECAKAFIVTKAGASVTTDELIDFCKQRIARYKAPRSVDFVAALKRNPAGKLLKHELRKPYWQPRDRQVN